MTQKTSGFEEGPEYQQVQAALQAAPPFRSYDLADPMVFEVAMADSGP